MIHGWQSESTDGPKGAWGLLSFSLFLSLSLSFSLFLSLSLSFSLFLSLSLSFSLFLSLSLSFSLFLWLSTYIPTDLPTYLYLSVCLSIYLFICKLENEAIPRDDLSFWTWQHQKRGNSARRPSFPLNNDFLVFSHVFPRFPHDKPVKPKVSWAWPARSEPPPKTRKLQRPGVSMGTPWDRVPVWEFPEMVVPLHHPCSFCFPW